MFRDQGTHTRRATEKFRNPLARPDPSHRRRHSRELTNDLLRGPKSSVVGAQVPEYYPRLLPSFGPLATLIGQASSMGDAPKANQLPDWIPSARAGCPWGAVLGQATLLQHWPIP